MKAAIRNLDLPRDASAGICCDTQPMFVVVSTE